MSRSSKPSSLVTKNETKAERRARLAGESLVKPETVLTITPPAELKGRQIASRVWKRVLALQNETQAAKDGAPIITAFDERTLLTFCKMIEEENTLEAKLEKLDTAQEDLYKKVVKMKPTKDNLKDYLGLWSQFNGASANYKGMSARLDAHRSSMHEISKSLYLTPSSRAGVAPQAKEPDEPKNAMEKFLD